MLWIAKPTVYDQGTAERLLPSSCEFSPTQTKLHALRPRMRKIPDPRLHDSCNPKVRDPSLPVVTEYRPTANGLGKLYRMEPGKRVVLDSIEDQWEWNDVEDMADQDYRVSFSPAMSEHLMKVRDRLWAEYSTHPLYAARFNEPGFFESLPTSMGQVR